MRSRPCGRRCCSSRRPRAGRCGRRARAAAASARAAPPRSVRAAWAIAASSRGAGSGLHAVAVDQRVEGFARRARRGPVPRQRLSPAPPGQGERPHGHARPACGDGSSASRQRGHAAKLRRSSGVLTSCGRKNAAMLARSSKARAAARHGCRAASVGQRQRGAPGAADHQPACDAQVLAHAAAGRRSGRPSCCERCRRAAGCRRHHAGRGRRCGSAPGRTSGAAAASSPSPGRRAAPRPGCRRRGRTPAPAARARRTRPARANHAAADRGTAWRSAPARWYRYTRMRPPSMTPGEAVGRFQIFMRSESWCGDCARRRPGGHHSARDECIPAVSSRHRATHRRLFHAMANPGCGRLPLRFRNHDVRRRSLSD